MTAPQPTPRNAVEFDNVCVVFGDHPGRALPLMDQGLDRGTIKARTGQVLGVHDCSLSVKEGEIVVLMGLSGSGKSTLLRAVNALNRVARGEVRVWDGARMTSVTGADKRALRQIRTHQVAMVFQHFGLLPWRSVRENVGLGLELARIPAAESRERIDRQLANVGLVEWADRRVAELSGGMQQRVGLARAFATEAPILLMDEPFSALDPLIRSRLQDELLQLQARSRRTIIFVSHDLDEAFKLGNRIALMDGGRIVQVGTAHDIIADPANDYVADFISHMNPLGVLTASDILVPGDAPGTPVPRSMPVRQVMEHLAGVEALPVEGGGIVTRDAVLRRLIRPRA